MFTRTAKNRERKLSEKLNDLTHFLPAEFLGDSRLWKSLIKTRRQRNSQGIPQNSCGRTQKFRHFSDSWGGCRLPCWGGALHVLQWNTFHLYGRGVLPPAQENMETDPTSSKWHKKSLESLSSFIPVCQWRQTRADTRELLEAAQSSFDVPAAAPCFDVSTKLCLSEPSLMVKFYCLPGTISPLIPSLHPVRRFLSSSLLSELLLRSGSHCDSCKGTSFSEPVVLFLSCFCWLLGVLGVLFTPSLWVLQCEQ